MERRYLVEIKRLSTGTVKEIVDVLAHSKSQAREYAKTIYVVGRYGNTVVGKATEYVYK